MIHFFKLATTYQMKNLKQTNTFRSTILGAIIFLLLGVQPIFSQDGNETECPFFNIESGAQDGVAFALLSSDVDATISGVIANVKIEQTYFNSGDSIIDASYIFPMSTNAAVYGMKMIVNERVITAVIKRKEEAQEIFDTANEAGQTASLLELQRPNVFQMSLANIVPGDTVKIEMVYTELLVPEKGEYQFVFPTIVGPRFTNEGEEWVNQSIQDSFPTAETELNIDLKIIAGMVVNADCKSHDVTFNYEGSTVECSLSTNPAVDFIVDYTLDRGAIETGLLLYEGPEENFFLSMIQPAKPDTDYESPDREYIFIMDVSGSMNGEPLEISKTLITNLLNDLRTTDKFNIMFFAGGNSILFENSRFATLANIDEATSMINSLSSAGSTQLLPALNRALNMSGVDGFSRTFVILSDGYVTVEKEAFQLIRENLNEANFFAFGIGGSVNRFIIEGIAYVGEGEAFVATDNEDAFELAARFGEYIERPALTNIQVDFSGVDVYDVEPISVPDVFAERPIIVYGKYNTPANGRITITGDYDEVEISSVLSFEDYTENMEENIALKYLWARKKIRLMSDYGVGSNENDTISIEEEITLLGLQYSLVTEFTSFVAVDSLSVSTAGETGGENEDNGDDTSSISEWAPERRPDKNYLNLGRNINSEEQLLELSFENIRDLIVGELMLRITDINGRVLQVKDLRYADLENILTLRLDGMSSGIYFVSLVSEDEILDTEKFMIF